MEPTRSAHDEGASIFSVRAYRDIRRLIPDDALRLSEGRNAFPVSPILAALTARLFDRLITSNRVSDYENTLDLAERRLLAFLLQKYLQWPELSEESIVFVSGAQEGISLIYAWAAQQRHATILPLPTYYAFEQSANRWRVPISAYVSVDGSIHGESGRDALDVRVIPNAATSTLFPPPPVSSPPAFMLIDAISQTGEFDGSNLLISSVRTLLSSSDLERTAVLMTASKDLSMPRLRAGVLVTRNASLLNFMKNDRFERISAPNPVPAQVMAYYLGLLLARAARADEETMDLAAAFEDAKLTWLSPSEIDAILKHWSKMAEHCAANFQVLLTRGRRIRAQITPRAGYSALIDIDPPFEDATSYLAWCREAGIQHGLRLNPSLVLGGTPDVWDALYPKRSLLRVNLSGPPDLFAAGLERLAVARDASLRVRSRP